MKTVLECIPCFLRQALDAGRMATTDAAVHEKILRAVLKKVYEMSFLQSPPHMGQEIHRIIRELSGNRDPYAEIKSHFNRAALDMYQELKEKVRSAEHPFETAVRLAIAGNIIDFAFNSNKDNIKLTDAVDDTLSRQLVINHIAQLKGKAVQARSILYLGDNAGEIVFDRILIEELPVERTAFAVKAQPIINDVTREDAEFVGMTEIVEVIDNGSDAPGTILETCSDEFRRRFEQADLVISKGQGNYETLNTIDQKNIFHLLKVKCPVIAKDIGCDEGSIIVLEQRL